jgi:hypothetical protein
MIEFTAPGCVRTQGHSEAVAAALQEALPLLPAAALAAVQDPGKPQRFADALKGLLSCLQSSKQLLPDAELLDKATRKKLADAVNAARLTDPPPKVGPRTRKSQAIKYEAQPPTATRRGSRSTPPARRMRRPRLGPVLCEVRSARLPVNLIGSLSIMPSA